MWFSPWVCRHRIHDHYYPYHISGVNSGMSGLPVFLFLCLFIHQIHKSINTRHNLNMKVTANGISANKPVQTLHKNLLNRTWCRLATEDILRAAKTAKARLAEDMRRSSSPKLDADRPLVRNIPWRWLAGKELSVSSVSTKSCSSADSRALSMLRTCE